MSHTSQKVTVNSRNDRVATAQQQFNSPDQLNIDLPESAKIWNSCTITYDTLHVDEEHDPLTDNALEAVREELFDLVNTDPRAAIAKLEDMRKRLPDSRTLLNWLSAAYAHAGDQIRSNVFAKRNYELHPKYLFARTNYARMLLSAGKVEQAAEVMDHKWDLKSLYPERDVFHVTEFMAVAMIAVEYFVRTDRKSAAEVILGCMRKLAPESDLTREAERIFNAATLSDSMREIAEMYKKNRDEGWGWRFDGLESWSTEAIFKQLQELGIQTDSDRFRQQAADAGGFNVLEKDWVAQISAEKMAAGFWADFPLLSVPVLWERLTPDLICADLIERRLHQAIDATENDKPLPDVDGMPADLAAALAMTKFLREVEPSQRATRFSEIDKEDTYDYVNWLLELIEISHPDHLDAITEIADVMSDCREKGKFQSALAQALATGGRREQAIARSRDNVAQFPDDPWVRIYAGEVFSQFDDIETAINLWLETLPLVNDSYEWDTLVENLKQAFDTTDRSEDDLDLILQKYSKPADSPSDYPDLAFSRLEPQYAPPPEPREPLTSARTVGRNDPCPCGSGKKYKKCCLQ